MPQTTYSNQEVIAYAGHTSDTRDQRVDARRNDHASPVAYGKAVSKSSASDGFGFVPPAAGSHLLGVLIYHHSRERPDTAIPLLGIGSILSQGRVWVPVENAVVPGDNVLVRIDSGGSGAGSFRGGAAVGGSLSIIPAARFLRPSTLVDGVQLVEIELNLPPVPVLS